MYKIAEYMFEGMETRDGAGVKLRRIFGSQQTVKLTDPFLLLDAFGSKNPDDYLAGFPWHPHRGIETVTYALKGKVYHRDSEDNSGTIYPGDVQWMTAGSGIFHEEMPKYMEDNAGKILDTELAGFQLWINLPASQKMSTPVYRSLKSNEIPEISGDGIRVRVIAGKYMKVQGIYSGGTQDISYFHISMDPEAQIKYISAENYRVIIYIISGSIKISGNTFMAGNAVSFSLSGDEIDVYADVSSEILLMSGRPLNEPVYWYGPIVMNTREQIEEAINDINNNKFVREKHPVID
ncbi:MULTISPECIES: pirin family protein [Acidiplasma]|uniref:Pirin n=2 Tax=Acidiplasma TaxID=507753 RepID=A0A0Q0XLX8_9ARCH|nr:MULTISPECIES: pirin family protein [Acidiplasma]KPV46690.1 hypothetical protein SE19_04435 [Acidiplasma aeolicum]KQB36187.1 hypothetical protein AOG54_07880 [Acidiplasma aeolicum]KQB36461.1 hypothetical protein AOG55_04015 [Acidiplasma cupricumulans]